ncbi:MAG: tetratricopeptide repeat protein [Anaerolineales bacterium]|nr:tetratricopeptide repeat protein [Anaerolineales bacterium]
MAEDTMLQDAIEAIRRGDKAKAKELLTRLLTADQKNATYWVWMSAAVETKKERIYALRTALNIDAENAAAQRGLVLMGAIPPDETIQPFPLDHPRLWEEELSKPASELADKPKGLKGLLHSPMARLAALLVIGAGVIGFGAFSLIQQLNRPRFVRNTNTPGPSPTFTQTPTALNAKAQGTPTYAGPTPLSALLDVPYTPTPLYVDTPRSIEARDYNSAALSAYRKGDWESVIVSMEQIAGIEPDKADPYYYIGEAHRFMGENAEAFDAYNRALEIDPDFGPANLGRARVLPFINSRVSILDDLNKAIKKSPDFAEAYIERARYYMSRNNYEDALADLETAAEVAPNSADVYINLSRAYFEQDDQKAALEAAQKAYELDVTALDLYLLLGEIYIANDQAADAVNVLETYIVYDDENVEALTLLGQAEYAAGNYETAISIMDDVLAINRKTGAAYLYRGLSYLVQKDGENAKSDLETARAYLPKSFEASLGLAQADALLEHYGDCYLQVERTRPLVDTDYRQALIYYWRATCHEGREDIRAATADWEALLEMPFSAESSFLRAEAREHLAAIYTPTPTRTVTPTPTPSPTKTPKE